MVDPRTLEPGDVVFYKPAGFSLESPVDVANFATLAAHVQSAPYGESRPWHHVAVCVARDFEGSGPAVVGFRERRGTTHFGSVLELINPIELPDGIEIDALRPDGEIAERLVSLVRDQAMLDSGRKQDGAAYALGGLLGFALMMVVRMLPEDTDLIRGDFVDLAHGADAVAQTIASESCVSNVAKAVNLLVPLTFTEPPRPAEVPTFAHSVLALQNRVERRGEEFELELDLHRGGPLLVEHTSAYLEAIEVGVERVFVGLKQSWVKEVGRSSRAAIPTVQTFLNSPAMLHEALLGSGKFTPLGATRDVDARDVTSADPATASSS